MYNIIIYLGNVPIRIQNISKYVGIYQNIQEKQIGRCLSKYKRKVGTIELNILERSYQNVPTIEEDLNKRTYENVQENQICRQVQQNYIFRNEPIKMYNKSRYVGTYLRKCTNRLNPLFREYLMSPSSHTNEGKTDFVELKNVTLNGWLETAEPPKATQAPIPQLIHHYPGYL